MASAAGSSVVNVTVASNAVGAGEPGAAGGANPQGTNGSPGLDGVGGGVFVPHGSALTLKNTLLYTNGSGGNCGPTGSTAIETVVLDGGHNLTFSLPTIGHLHTPACPATFLAKDPKLGPLQNNAGPTFTMALGPGSAAINQVPAGPGCPATDQRGLRRPSGSACDIGAYEVTPPSLTPGPVAPLTSTGATVNAKARANALHATVRLVFGRTAAYGSQTAPQTITGTATTAISVHLAKLSPRTKYHYRWVASSPDGTTMTPDASFPTPRPPPRLSALKLKPHSFRVRAHGHGGTNVSYVDSGAAKTSFTVQRCVKLGKHHRCQRYDKVGTFTHGDRIGHNSFGFSGRINGHALAPGRYRLVATPKANGQVGKTITGAFRVLA